MLKFKNKHLKIKLMELIPYLTFNGNCNEAMEYYKAVLDGKFGMLVDQFDVQWMMSTPH